jgi:hypothetical protein
MGYIASRHPDARFVVVSNDRGYGPMLEHAEELGFSARQAEFGAPKAATRREPLLSLAPAQKAAAKKASPAAKLAGAQTTAASKTAVAATAKSKTAAKAPAKKAAAKKTASKPAAKSAATTAAAKSAPAKMAQGMAHVVASLKKTASKPVRPSKLLAMIQSLLGTTAEDPSIQQMLSELRAAGKVTINDKGGVQYSL